MRFYYTQSFFAFAFKFVCPLTLTYKCEGAEIQTVSSFIFTGTHTRTHLPFKQGFSQWKIAFNVTLSPR